MSHASSLKIQPIHLSIYLYTHTRLGVDFYSCNFSYQTIALSNLPHFKSLRLWPRMAYVNQNSSSIEVVFTFPMFEFKYWRKWLHSSTTKRWKYPMNKMTLCSCLPPREAVVFSIYLSWIRVLFSTCTTKKIVWGEILLELDSCSMHEVLGTPRFHLRFIYLFIYFGWNLVFLCKYAMWCSRELYCVSNFIIGGPTFTRHVWIFFLIIYT